MLNGATQTEMQNDIRVEILQQMEKLGHNLSSFSKLLGVNRGTLSSTFNGNPLKPIPIKLLDLMAKVLGFQEGWLYEAYVQECFPDGKGHWRRIKAFLQRCIELDRIQLVKKVLFQALEDLTRLQDVFALGEELYIEGKWKQSIPFFQCVAEHEIKQHSERLAISHYKWFRAELGVDTEKNMAAALRFAPFRSRLPEQYQLDGLLQLANVYFILKKWDDVKKIASELHAMVLIHLHQQKVRSRRGLRESLATERHLVVYYGQSFLLRGNALEKQGDYKQSLSYLTHYEDLNWFDNLDETGLKEVEKFSMYAKANRVNLHVLMGDFEFLPDYMAFLDSHPSELLSGLITILEAAYRYQYDIDEVLLHFDESIRLMQTDCMNLSFYPLSFTLDRHADLFHRLALYSFNHARTKDGIDYLLQALNSAIQANNKNLTIDCTAWFEQYRQQAVCLQVKEYEFIMKGVIEDAQMDYVAAGRCDS